MDLFIKVAGYNSKFFFLLKTGLEVQTKAYSQSTRRIFRITRLVDCEYALVWTSRPVLSKKKNFELYPATFINKSIHNEEFNVMKRFLKGAGELLEKSNEGIKEYFFE